MPPPKDERKQLRAPLKGSAAKATKEETKDVECGQSLGFYGAVTEAAQDPVKWFQGMTRWLETSDSTDPTQIVTFICDDFRARRVKAPMVLLWIFLQALGLMFQVLLLSEISRNLAAYQETLRFYCGPEHQLNGVCLGPTWNMSYAETLVFPATAAEASQRDFDYVVPTDQRFSFNTLSSPATFLIGVEPLGEHTDVRWQLDITPKDPVPWGTYGQNPPPLYGWGSRFSVVAAKAFTRPMTWNAAMSVTSTYQTDARVHLYVLDSRIQHLEDVHKQEQCDFEGSWQNFNERESSKHHRVLSFAQNATTFFLLVQLCLVGLVIRRFFFYVESGKLLSRVIATKFLIQDFPQQMCIVFYLYSWYANNGLHCQMCLFHPEHCDNQHPLHWTNSMVCIFTLLSACANQFLIQAKLKRYDEDEECLLFFTRLTLFSVSVLPFSTSIFLLSASVLHLRSPLVYFIAGIPTILGWGALCCVPMIFLCDDEL